MPYTADSIFRLYYRPLCLYSLHYLQSPQEAEDVVQDCLADFIERTAAGAEVADPKAYLFMMVRNRSLDTLRAARYSSPDVCVDDLAETAADDDALQDDSFAEARMWTVIDSLPAKRREVLLLGKRDGLAYEEIATELGISVNTVRNHMAMALKALREGCRKIYAFFFG